MAIAIGTTACAPVSKLPQIDEQAAKAEREIQYELAFRQFYGNIQRVHRVAYPLLKASAGLCGDAMGRGLGFYLANKHAFKKEYWNAAERSAGLGEALKVIGVAPGSAAARAGVREGDTPVTVDGWQIPEGEDAPSKFQEKLGELAKGSYDTVFTVRRDDALRTITVKPDVVCNYTCQATERSLANASADGKNIRVEAGMLRLLPDDDDLAVIIGHEIAHNVMDHIPKGRANVLLGSVVDVLFAGFGVNTQGAFGKLGQQAFSPEFEAEADYVGLYIVARAGRKFDGAPNVWRKMVLDDPGGIKERHADSHPSSPHRFLALETTVKEIKAKQAASKPLVPEKQETPLAPPPSLPTQ